MKTFSWVISFDKYSSVLVKGQPLFMKKTSIHRTPGHAIFKTLTTYVYSGYVNDYNAYLLCSHANLLYKHTIICLSCSNIEINSHLRIDIFNFSFLHKYLLKYT